jgi:hypothetical protein
VGGVAAVTYGLTETVWSDAIDAWRFVPRTGGHAVWVPVVACVLYLAMVAVLPRLMRDRAPVQLQWTMFVHNVILSAGSLVMTIAVAREVRTARGTAVSGRGQGRATC